jgi:hypothetical protein
VEVRRISKIRCRKKAEGISSPALAEWIRNFNQHCTIRDRRWQHRRHGNGSGESLIADKKEVEKAISLQEQSEPVNRSETTESLCAAAKNTKRNEVL